MTQPLSVIIPCKNEADNIRACLDSVRGVADEIVVADSGSTDGTLDIVRQLHLDRCRIIQREFIGYADFKNWAAGHATHRWVLFVDADERLTDSLADEIRSVLAGSPAADAYAMRFQPYFLGCPIRHCGWNTTTAVRLVRRDLCHWVGGGVHERVDVPADRTAMLQGRFLHYSCRSWKQWLEKLDQYTALAAEEKFAAGRRARYFDLLVRPGLRFVQTYLLRAGFLDGTPGLIVCAGTAYYTFLKYAKLWQLTTLGAGLPTPPKPPTAGLPRPHTGGEGRPPACSTAGSPDPRRTLSDP